MTGFKRNLTRKDAAKITKEYIGQTPLIGNRRPAYMTGIVISVAVGGVFWLAVWYFFRTLAG